MSVLRWVHNRNGSWHVYHYTTESGRDIVYCGRHLPRADDWTDKPLPDGKTCEMCLRVKASKEGR